MNAPTTAHFADACIRLGIPLRIGPLELRAVRAGLRFIGRAIPVQHFGSADIFFEAIDTASRGDVLVIDNNGRLDEACVGDLVALEAKAAGIAGIIIWGLHRDTAEIAEMKLPVFSLGATPVGPRRLDHRTPNALVAATVGMISITAEDVIVADDDGILAIPSVTVDDLMQAAEKIRETEGSQATAVKNGLSLRHQLQFSRYQSRRRENPDYTFRQHVRETGGAIEE